MVPYYNKPTQDGMLLHFGAIAEATTLPIVVYNIPGRTGANMLPATFTELTRRHPNIAGIKESTGDTDQFTEMLRLRTRDDVTFWSGDDYMFLPSLAVGGYGLISVAGHLVVARAQGAGRGLRRRRRRHGGAHPPRPGPADRRAVRDDQPDPGEVGDGRYGFKAGACRSPLGAMPDALAAALEPLIAPYRP